MSINIPGFFRGFWTSLRKKDRRFFIPGILLRWGKRGHWPSKSRIQSCEPMLMMLTHPFLNVPNSISNNSWFFISKHGDYTHENTHMIRQIKYQIHAQRWGYHQWKMMFYIHNQQNPDITRRKAGRFDMIHYHTYLFVQPATNDLHSMNWRGKTIDYGLDYVKTMVKHKLLYMCLFGEKTHLLSLWRFYLTKNWNEFISNW